MPESTKITARVRLLIIFRYVHKTIICKSWLKGYITSNTDRTQFAWKRLNISNWTTKIRLEYVHVVNHYKQQHIIRKFFFKITKILTWTIKKINISTMPKNSNKTFFHENSCKSQLSIENRQFKWWCFDDDSALKNRCR